MLGLSLADFQRLRIDDLTPPDQLPELEMRWSRLLQNGHSVSRYAFVSPGGARLEVSFFALANALPGRHLGAFVPASWPDDELLSGLVEAEGAIAAPLTPRELEVLELAAEGHTGPMIARELVVSASTIRSHFEHIYSKLEVGDRAAAVAKAIRLGLIS